MFLAPPIWAGLIVLALGVWWNWRASRWSIKPKLRKKHRAELLRAVWERNI